MRITPVIVLALGMLLLAGCVLVPLPHLSKSSPRLGGRIVDAETGKPIERAVVSLKNHEAQDFRHASVSDDIRPGASTISRSNGTFHIGSRYNLHFLWYANPSFQAHIPFGTYWLGELEVSREGYQTLIVTSSDGSSVRDFGDLRLVPKTAVVKP